MKAHCVSYDEIIADPILVLQNWYHTIRILHRAHYETAKKYEHRGQWIGFPSALLSAITGSTLFATLDSSTDLRTKAALGTISFIAAIISVTQAYFRYGERADKHKVAGSKYGIIRREAEETLSFARTTLILTPDYMKEFRERWEVLEAESPLIPPKIYERCADLYECKSKTRSTPSSPLRKLPKKLLGAIWQKPSAKE